MGLCKQQKLHADAKAIEKINFTGNLTRFGEAGMFFYNLRSERTSFRFF